MRLALVLLAGCTATTAASVAPAPEPVQDASSSAELAPASCSAPAWVAPAAPQRACTAAERAEFEAACLDHATAIPIACEQYRAEHGTCAACLFPEAGPAGAYLARPGAVSPNVGGCIALALADPSDDGCGAREQRARDCPDDADAQLARCPELAGAAPCLLEEAAAIAARFCGP